MNLNSNESAQDIAEVVTIADPIVYDLANLPVYLKKGPYGWYLQVGDNAKDVGFKRVKIPESIKPQDITSEQALKLIALPRIVGQDMDHNDIIVAIGKFGPYLKYKDKLTSLPKDKNPFTIDISDALQVIEAKIQKEAKKAAQVQDVPQVDELPKIKQKSSSKKIAKKSN